MKKQLDLLKSCAMKVKIVIVAFVVIAILGTIVMLLLRNTEPEMTIVSESGLKEILDIDELTTLEYFYNSIAQVKDEETADIKYHAAYKGTVRLGIEMEQIEVNVDEENKQIDIILPEVKLMDCNIDPDTLDFIFEKDKYETETVIVEANKMCILDLKEKVMNDKDLLDLAKESAIDAIRALICPWVDQVADEYTVVVK